jgi:large subunit ribosomal protein L18
MKKIEQNKVIRRKIRISQKVRGSEIRPRISVFRSNINIYAQAINDVGRMTIASYSSKILKKQETAKIKKSEQAKNVGLSLGKILLEKKVKTAVFDRGQYAYNGRVKALCEGLREAGIKI